MVVQHQRNLRCQQLQGLEIAGAVTLLTLAAAEHKSPNWPGADAQRSKAFDRGEERSLRRAEEFLDVLLAVGYAGRARLIPVMLWHAYQRQHTMSSHARESSSGYAG